MAFEFPEIPAGTGQNPVALVVITATDLAASRAFYEKIFGWRAQPLSPELIALEAPGGPACALRSNMPEGFPGVVPYIAVDDVPAAFDRVLAAGASAEKAPWKIPMIGAMARFADASGTIWGLTGRTMAAGLTHMPLPFGGNAKPYPGALCSLEMYAADGDAAAAFFHEQFGWGTCETMPQFVGFDPGTGPGGVFQSHTPTLPAVAYIYARDAAAKLEELEQAGGTRLGDPMGMPGMATFAYFTDPSGSTLGLIGP